MTRITQPVDLWQAQAFRRTEVRPPRWLAGRSRLFADGLLLGTLLLCIWLTLGWWIGPGTGSDSASSQNAARMPTFASPAWEKYWRNLDVAKVQRDMAGWSREDLARLFKTVQEQAYDPETRQHLADLGKLLGLPGYATSTSLPSALLGQPGFVLAIFLSLAIWTATVALVVVPLIRHRANPPAELPMVENEIVAGPILEDMLPDVATEAAAPEEPKKEEEKKPEEPQADQEGEELSSGLGDLASLFEEEDTSLSALEAFCKDLPEVNIDNLLADATQLVRQLRAAISGQPTQSRARLEPGESL